LSIKETSPILIRNFGFNAMSIETDTVANEGSGNVPGYLAMGDGTVYSLCKWCLTDHK
jgi:hypothetical protein